MAKAKKYEIVIPSVVMRTPNEEVYQSVKTVQEKGLMATVISLLMHKMSMDPAVLSLEESSTDLKLSKTIDGLSAVSEVVNSMNMQMANSEKQMRQLASAVEMLNKSNVEYATTLNQMFEIMQNSKEGLELIKQMSNGIGDKFTTLIADASKKVSYAPGWGGAEVAATAVADIEGTDSSALGITTYGQNVADEDEEELIGEGMSNEDLLKAIQQFNGGE